MTHWVTSFKSIIRTHPHPYSSLPSPLALRTVRKGIVQRTVPDAPAALASAGKSLSHMTGTMIVSPMGGFADDRPAPSAAMPAARPTGRTSPRSGWPPPASMSTMACRGPAALAPASTRRWRRSGQGGHAGGPKCDRPRPFGSRRLRRHRPASCARTAASAGNQPPRSARPQGPDVHQHAGRLRRVRGRPDPHAYLRGHGSGPRPAG